jgi:DNA-directed RNA polymerase subunit RPC12/RpoP
MPRNDAQSTTMPEELMPDDDTQHCFECEHDYSTIGTPPGVCPECGSRAVSMVGTLTKLDVREQDRLNTAVQRATTGETSVLEVMVADETDRLFVFYVTGTVTDGPELRVSTVKYEDRRFSPADPEWTDDLVPELVLDIVKEETGTRPSVAMKG